MATLVWTVSHNTPMLFLNGAGPLAVPTEYRIVAVRQKRAFAGKLGQRVSEDLVIARGETTILVHVAGSYHTMAVRPGQRLNVGDAVAIQGPVKGDGETVSRHQIKKISSKSSKSSPAS